MSLKDTTKLLLNLRALMKDARLLNGKALQAYIVPASDPHGSEYLNPKHKYREFISGFTGSSGTALITEQSALLWTDGRYYLQASQELDSNWQLMKDGLPATPSISEWLNKNLTPSSLIGIDASLYQDDLFNSLANKLRENQLELIHVDPNLVQVIWNDNNQPSIELKPLVKLNPEDCGKKSRDKLDEIRKELTRVNCKAFVVTSLDEIAWILNIRGFDIPYGAVFFSYLIITDNSVKLFTNTKRLDAKCSDNQTFKEYLLDEDKAFEFYEYDEFYGYFKSFVDKEFTMQSSSKKIFLSTSSNHLIHSMVPSKFVHKDTSYVTKLRVIKNSAEISSAKKIHIRDSRVLVEFFHQIQTNFKSADSYKLNVEPTEYKIGEFLDQMRYKEPGCHSPSFETICGFGSNGAIIHYKAKEEDCKRIEPNGMLLVDSGGHYTDMGTTDVTRTVFLGDPSKITPYQRECFTRVLKGHIQLALSVFPNNTKSEQLDSFARRALWQAGLDYGHGTGHGVGALLNVHEVPIIGIRRGTDINVQENMIITNEPGYYEVNQFGIRIENCYLTCKKPTKYSYNSTEFLAFEPLTYVPIQRELIDKSLLSSEEIEWLNDYHGKCLSIVGEELLKKNSNEVFEWLKEQTKPL